MNSRDYKQSVAGEIYHIYNRGNRKEDIFLDSQDKNFFRYRLCQYLFPEREKLEDLVRIRTSPLPENSFDLISYCLMPNHFHLIFKQNTEIPISKLISRVCTSYSKYFNKKYDKVGHLFQDQFKQVNISDNNYLLWLSAYIHQNPKVANIVIKADEYQWSSYAHYLGNRTDTIIKGDTLILDQFKTKNDYRKFVDDSYKIIKDKKDLENILID